MVAPDNLPANQRDPTDSPEMIFLTHQQWGSHWTPDEPSTNQGPLEIFMLKNAAFAVAPDETTRSKMAAPDPWHPKGASQSEVQDGDLNVGRRSAKAMMMIMMMMKTIS